MSDTPWPVEGLTLAEAFERTADRALWDTWQAGREYLGIYSPALVLVNDGVGSWMSSADRRKYEEQDAMVKRARKALETLSKQFREMLQAGQLVTTGRINNCLAERTKLERDAWFYLDPIARASESVACGPDGVRVFNIRVHLGTKAPAVAVPAAATRPRGRGRKPNLRDKVALAMQSDINNGKLTVASLSNMSEKEMQHRYGGVSRDTCRKARHQAVSEINSRQFATNDK